MEDLPFAPDASREVQTLLRAAGPDPYIRLLNTPTRALLRKSAVTLPVEASILEAAQRMRDQRVSSILLVREGYLFGIVTDRDLRNRALASGLDPNASVMEIATVAPMTVEADKPAFEAMILMTRHNIHHVPVLERGRVLGMITSTDVMRQHSTSAVYLAGEVHDQSSVEHLAQVSSKVRDLQSTLAASNASAYTTGRIITTITDAITSRLLELTEAELGPPPIPYVWVAAGSQARSEQTARSDQDNCLVLDDAYDPQSHGPYFKELAHRVNQGLDACGYVFCPGDMMARTETWRQPSSRWSEYFRRWTDEPDPQSLMLTCVFFDLRGVYGDLELVQGLRRRVLQATKGNRIFLAHMVNNALKHRPPLSLFGGLNTVQHDDARDTIDLKHNGVVPIIDLARVYALAGGHEEVNTHDRLMMAARGHEISEQGAHDLRDALEFLGRLRFRHQVDRLNQGLEPNNFLSLSHLSNFEKTQLKDAFKVVAELQNVLANRYR